MVSWCAVELSVLLPVHLFKRANRSPFHLPHPQTCCGQHGIATCHSKALSLVHVFLFYVLSKLKWHLPWQHNLSYKEQLHFKPKLAVTGTA